MSEQNSVCVCLFACVCVSNRASPHLSMHVPLSLPIFLRLLLLLGLTGAALQEVAPQQAIEQHYVHGRHDCHAHAAHGVGEQRHVVTVQDQPAGHPCQGVDAEHHVSAQVDHAVDAVQGARCHVGHEQHLAQVQEHRIDLHQQRHHGKAHVAAGDDRDAETSDDLEERMGRRGGED